ncbi:MAG: hypothetical protein II567_16670, partial [Candidatus Riflebacteria bacterium]|nr:hypothetical protein [Candidatus Riflebacteria bacterium]
IMINFLTHFRSSLPYKSGSFISAFLSFITIFVYRLIYCSDSLKGEAGLFVMPLFVILIISYTINVVFFIIFNVCIILWLPVSRKNKQDTFIFADLAYLFSISINIFLAFKIGFSLDIFPMLCVFLMSL